MDAFQKPIFEGFYMQYFILYRQEWQPSFLYQELGMLSLFWPK